MIKLFSLFSGIGAFEKALSRLNIKYELVGFSEIDKFAVKSYCAIHNITEDKNYGDITKIDEKELPDFDIMTWGFPCQDISIAGKMEGIKEGKTRSGLYYEGYRILKEKLPKYSIIENVKNLTSKRFEKEFKSILEDIKKLGYTNYWQVLNAKDYGIPQNRERVFIISIRNDVDNNKFQFPQKQDLKLKLKDILEEQVEEKYYLSENAIGKLIEINNSEIKEKSSILIKDGSKVGYTKANVGDSINYSYLNNLKKRGRVGKGVAQTILTTPTIAVLEKTNKPICLNKQESLSTQNRVYDTRGIFTTLPASGFKPKIAEVKMFNSYNKKEIIDVAPTQTTSCGNTTSSSAVLISEDKKSYMRIRKLTPLECWRLMGFEDNDFYKTKSKGISDTQLYRQAGNSIVVNVLEGILRKLLFDLN